MSDLVETKKAVQTILQTRGIYTGKIDGLDGRLTWNAIAAALGVGSDAAGEAPAAAGGAPALPDPGPGTADPRSERYIRTLNPAVQPLARKFLAACVANGIDAKIISGYRTYGEQATLYARYKAGGPTAAPPGHSNHNFGLAFDVGIFDGSRYLEESGLYRKAGQLGKDVGLLWGGDWSNGDEPHFEMRPQWAAKLSESGALAAYRQRLAVGMALV